MWIWLIVNPSDILLWEKLLYAICFFSAVKVLNDYAHSKNSHWHWDWQLLWRQESQSRARRFVLLQDTVVAHRTASDVRATTWTFSHVNYRRLTCHLKSGHISRCSTHMTSMLCRAPSPSKTPYISTTIRAASVDCNDRKLWRRHGHTDTLSYNCDQLQYIRRRPTAHIH